jgi:hypothetical protein
MVCARYYETLSGTTSRPCGKVQQELVLVWYFCYIHVLIHGGCPSQHDANRAPITWSRPLGEIAQCTWGRGIRKRSPGHLSANHFRASLSSCPRLRCLPDTSKWNIDLQLLLYMHVFCIHFSEPDLPVQSCYPSRWSWQPSTGHLILQEGSEENGSTSYAYNGPTTGGGLQQSWQTPWKTTFV